MTRFDSALVPDALAATTLTKYVPDGAVTEILVAPALNGRDATTGPLGASRARIVYDVGVPPPPALHASVTSLPALTTGAFIVGDCGGCGPSTTTATSLDAGLLPPALVARTRTKYVPGATPATCTDVTLPATGRVANGPPPAVADAMSRYWATAPPLEGAIQLKVTVAPVTF